jgi:hypothetical protein
VKVLRQDVTIGKSREDTDYGHWWLEQGPNLEEGYGWWPERPVSLWETLFGTKGVLNRGFAVYPHTGDRGPGISEFDVYATEELSSPEAVYSAVRSFANLYSGSWSWHSVRIVTAFRLKCWIT